MAENNIIFKDRNINKSIVYRSKRLFNTDDIDINEILISKKELYRKKVHLNTSLDMIIIIILIHYAQCCLR